MLQTCSNVLLLTKDEYLIKEYQSLAVACEVNLRVEDTWDEMYRINADRIITTSEYIYNINESYYPSVVLILKDDETFIPYRDKIDYYIFDKGDARELMFAFLKQDVKFAQYATNDLQEIMLHSNTTHYIRGSYDFDFAKGNFLYRGKRLYITAGQQSYLAEWLLSGHKDNSKRMNLLNMRKKFGKEFLLDVDRYGQLKGL